MILVDYNAVAISAVIVQITRNNETLTEDFAKHVVINSLRKLNKQFRNDYGQLVLCCDSRHYWRKDIFKYYKAKRAGDRAKSNIDWDFIFKMLDIVKTDVRNNFPFPVMEVYNAEGDDLMAVLATSSIEPTVVASNDGDMVQLLKEKNVKLWAPLKRKMITHPDPADYLFEHIIRGDSGDGVPNMFSDDDTFVTEGKRQKQVITKKVDHWKTLKFEDFWDNLTGVEKRNWARNNKLVNLNKLPDGLCEEIIDTFYKNVINSTTTSNAKLLTYFAKNGMKQLAGCISDFTKRQTLEDFF